jgi:hypothetical protein
MKKPKYEPLQEGEILDLSAAFSQAAVLLDNAAAEALRTSNLEKLIDVADRWIIIGKTFVLEGSEHVDTNSTGQYGFGPHGNEVNDDGTSETGDEGGGESIWKD